MKFFARPSLLRSKNGKYPPLLIQYFIVFDGNIVK